MPTLTPSAAALIALACGGWLAAALWATLRGLSRSRAASGRMGEGVRAEALLAAAPAVPLLVSKEGRLHGPDRTAFLLGLDSLPGYLADLGTALGEAGLGALSQSVAAAAASGAGFAHAVRPEGGSRVLELRGGPAPAPWPSGTVLIWILDSTESEGRLAALDARSARLAAALDALSGLIEAAPFPMWHRGPDLALAMVNSAYVEAVEGEDSGSVVAAGTELIDTPDGAMAQAAAARESGAAHVRTLPATIAGERRTLQVVEVPLARRASPAMRSTSRTESRRAPTSPDSSAPSATCSTGSRPGSPSSAKTGR
jgi:PAS domain-containing protein